LVVLVVLVVAVQAEKAIRAHKQLTELQAQAAVPVETTIVAKLAVQELL
jgi:hypothetical protein